MITFERTKTIVLKTTNSCNLNCDYCYDEENNYRTFSILYLEGIERIFLELINYAKKRTINHLNLVWHGGEPLTLGINYFKKVIKLQKSLNFSFGNLIQTNATLLDADWAEFFKQHDFNIGVSFDGSLESNSIHRQKSKIVINNIQLLNTLGITPSIISVISDKNYELYSSMFKCLKGLQFKYIDFIPCYENNGRHTLSNDNYAFFMKKIFDLWLDSGKIINVRFFQDTIMKMLGSASETDFIMCSLTGKCGEIISINSNGQVYYCDCLPKEEQYCIGNISEGFNSLVNSKSINSLNSLNNHTHEECKKCEYLSLCGKGCLNRRLNMNHGLSTKDYYCDARKEIFDHIKNKLGLSKITNNVFGTPSFTRGPKPSKLYSN